MPLYSIRTIPKGYRIAKFDPDYNLQATYEVHGSTCDCPQSRRGECKHLRDLLPEFKRMARIDTGHFFDPEYDTWFPPLAEADVKELVRRA